MQSKKISKYIYFGTVIRYIQDLEAGTKVNGTALIRENLESFFSYLNEFNLVVTKRASYQLQGFFASLPLDSDYSINEDEAKKLRTLMSDIRNTLFAEAGGNIAFIVTDKRIDVNKLLNNIASLFSPEIFSKLPEIAKYDFQEAGKCIGFERSTAAAFHLLRGTEDVLRTFYCAIVKQKRVNPLLWGPMVSSLKKRRNPPPDVLLANLDNIRTSFRNPTQHPDKIYNIEEVQDLFGLCIDVVNRMIPIILCKK